MLYQICTLGYWLFHCHLEFHSEVGMGVIFKIGEHADFPPLPENFPTCGDWASSPKTNNANLNSTITKGHYINLPSDAKRIPVVENELLPSSRTASFFIHSHASHDRDEKTAADSSLAFSSAFSQHYNLPNMWYCAATIILFSIFYEYLF